MSAELGSTVKLEDTLISLATDKLAELKSYLADDEYDLHRDNASFVFAQVSTLTEIANIQNGGLSTQGRGSLIKIGEESTRLLGMATERDRVVEDHLPAKKLIVTGVGVMGGSSKKHA